MAKKNGSSRTAKSHVEKKTAKEQSHIERDLASLRKATRSLIDENEVGHTEMKAVNKLGAAKEKLQASNAELTHRNHDLNTLCNDLNNLLVGIQIPLLILDSRFNIRRFTPAAEALLNLTESDIGRSVSHIASALNVPGLHECFANLMGGVHPIEFQVEDHKSRWYLLRMRPYGASDNKIDGVIMALLDIDMVKRPLLDEARESSAYASVLLESSSQAIVAVGSDEKIVLVNGAAERMFDYRRDEIMGKPLGVLVPEGVRARHSEHLRAFFATPGDRPMGHSRNFEGRRKDGTVFPIEVSLSIIERRDQRLGMAFVTDLSENRRLEYLSEVYRREIGVLATQLITAQEEERRRVSRELHDSLCQQLASLAFDVESLAAVVGSPSAGVRLRELQRRIVRVSEEARHIAYELHPSMLDDLGLMVSLRALCDDFSKKEKIPVKFTAGKPPNQVPQEIASGLYRIAQESLHNVAKHAKAMRVSVELAVSASLIRLSIKDNGIGFDPATIKGKGGLGVASMSERARMLGGALSIETRPGHGVLIGVIVPVP